MLRSAFLYIWNSVPPETKVAIISFLDFYEFLHFRNSCRAIRFFSDQHQKAITQAILKSTYSGTLPPLCQRLYSYPTAPSSFPFEHLIHMERRLGVAREIAHDIAWDIFHRRVASPDLEATYNRIARIAKLIIPYVILLGHFFEQFRANLANLLLKDPSLLHDLSSEVLGESKHELTIQLEKDILERSYSPKVYQRLYVLYWWITLRLFGTLEGDEIDMEDPDQYQSNGYSRDVLLFGGLEALWNILDCKGSEKRESYVASHLRQALGSYHLPSYIKSNEPPIALPASMLPKLDPAIAEGMVQLGRAGQEFPYEENVKALNLPSMNEGDEEAEIEFKESLQSWDGPANESLLL